MEKNIRYNEDAVYKLRRRKIALGEMTGEITGYPSIDMPWLKYYTEEQILTPIPHGLSAYEYMYEHNKEYQNNIALNYFGRKITFGELFEKIDSTAKALIANGVRENTIVSVSLPNIPEAVYLFYAISKIGAIANMIDPRTSKEGIKKYLQEVDSSTLIIVDSYYNKVKDFTSEGIIPNIISVSPAESLPLGLNYGYKAKQYIEGIKDKKRKIKLNPCDSTWSEFILQGKNITLPKVHEIPNRPFVIEHTGGTTGSPKGVVLTNENINSVTHQSILTGVDMQREHTWLNIMPTFIAYGVGMGLHLPLTIGMETILIPQFDPNKFDKLLYKHKPVHFVGAPSHWESVLRSKKLKNADLSYIIAPSVGGDTMDINLEQAANDFLKEHNCAYRINKGYGMTEVSGGVCSNNEATETLGNVGIPFINTVISIFDPETGEEKQYNQTGEICITGPNTMLEYFNNETETQSMLRIHEDGKVWVHSGDIGYMTEDGRLFIIDRMKRVIIRYDGFKIFPSQIERIVSSHPAVKECKVVGIADQEHTQGKYPKVHIVLNESSESQPEKIVFEIKKLCEDKLPEYCLPIGYKIRETLPLTGIGKIDYRSLEAEDEHIKNLPPGKTLKKTN